jgi:acylphosphatase
VTAASYLEIASMQRVFATLVPLLAALAAAVGPAAEEKPPAPAAKARVDLAAGTVSIPAVVAEQGKYAEQLKGAIEYVLVAAGGKAYESLFVTEVGGLAIRDAFLRLGLPPGAPATEDALPVGPPIRILVEYERDGARVRRPADEFIAYKASGKAAAPAPWALSGSARERDPASDREVPKCEASKNLVGLHFNDDSPLLQNSRAEARTENIYKANLEALPKAGTAVTIVFEKIKKEVPAGAVRVHVFVSGRVQGVGYRAFTQREARRLELAGWAMNLPDGRVEAVIEGPREKVEKLIETMKRGPRGARVEKLESAEEPPDGLLDGFTVVVY